MSWKIRHEGSPRSIEGLSLQQVVEGLQDSLWEPTDEVMGPTDHRWVAIENHPQFAEIAADIEPPAATSHDDETRLDMNPLIDVCLVLLIFFILTTSYAALQRVLDMPTASAKNVNGPLVVSKQKVKELMIKIVARQEDGKSVIKLEDETVELPYLRAALSQYASQTRKTDLLIDARGVEWGTIVAIQDAAKGADMRKIYFASNQPTTPSAQ